jgi:hypothetical protein
VVCATNKYNANTTQKSMATNYTRRSFLEQGVKAGAAVAVAPLSISLSGCMSFVSKSPVTVLLPKDYESPSGISGWWYKRKLTQATMAFIREYHKPQRKFGVWGVPLQDIDYALEARLEEIVDWGVDACNENKDTHPVDPALLVAGMYAESLFYEFAVSSALAVGVAQFITTTARAKPYNMICAGESPEHFFAPYKLTQFAGEHHRFESLRKELREVKRQLKFRPKKQLQGEKEQIEAAIDSAKENYAAFLHANFAGRNVIDDDDRAFLSRFDQRTVHEHAVQSMALYIARSLKARNGNVLAAWSAYNAGLGSTRGRGYLRQYGKLPNGGTATYAQKIVLVADDLNRRMFG